MRQELRDAGLEPGCSMEEFDRRVIEGVRAYKQWSERVHLEKKPEEIWPDYYLRDFDFDRQVLSPSRKSWPTCGRSRSITGSCAPGRGRCSRP